MSVRAQGPVRVGVRFPFRTHPCGLVPASDFNWLVAASVGLWATFVGTLAGLLLHGPFTAGLPLSRSLDATLLTKTV